jgi:two-component system LytT family response regulator
MLSPASQPVTCLIVDDEGPARRIIRQYLQSVDGAEVIGECGNGVEAVEAIRELGPDLVFLDVQMPGLDGFEVIREIDELPTIVFSTAYDQYAVRAFEVNAVDYLLKPYDRTRFYQAVERALAADPVRRVQALLDHHLTSPEVETSEREDLADEEPIEHLLVEHQGRHVLIDADAIRWIEAAGDYSKLHTKTGTFLSRRGIGALAKRLDAQRFVRVHRSTIVAIDALRDLQRDGSGGFDARLIDGTTIRVSRSYAPALSRWMV